MSNHSRPKILENFLLHTYEAPKVRRDRDAECVEGVRCEEGVSPFPTGSRVWGAVPPSQKILEFYI